MLELLIAANFYCYMESPAGQVISLEHLCGGATARQTASRYEADTIALIEAQGWDAANWDVVALGDRYCAQLRQGLTRDEIAAQQAAITIETYGYLDDEPLSVLSAVATNAPEYLCPEFAD